MHLLPIAKMAKSSISLKYHAFIYSDSVKIWLLRDSQVAAISRPLHCLCESVYSLCVYHTVHTQREQSTVHVVHRECTRSSTICICIWRADSSKCTVTDIIYCCVLCCILKKQTKSIYRNTIYGGCIQSIYCMYSIYILYIQYP